jgi:hypothetical protein
MRTFVLTLLVLTFSLSVGLSQQKTKKETGQPVELTTLVLEKNLPLTFDPTSPCGRADLLTILADSLSREGFTIIDSATCTSLARAEFTEWGRIAMQAGAEKTKSALESRTKSKKIYQRLIIENYSCLDTGHNYQIGVYIFPREGSTRRTLTFTLPLNSNARISDVILSLITRQ